MHLKGHAFTGDEPATFDIVALHCWCDFDFDSFFFKPCLNLIR